jgi:NitT/TauT family transport system permease protein
MVSSSTTPRADSSGAGRTGAAATVRSVLMVILVLVAVWEGYKIVGKALDGMVPFTDIALRPPPDDRSMPHVWDIVGALFEPARRGGQPLWWVLTVAAMYTLREAVLGFLI